MTPAHTLHASLDDLLSIQALRQIEGRDVRAVHRRPFVSPYGGVSGNRFLAVESVGVDGARHAYVVKRTATAWDIIMRATGDTACRERLIWQSGLLDNLPPAVGHTVAAAATDGDGWALLLRDITEQMHPCQRWPSPGWERLADAELTAFLDGLAALHATFWLDERLRRPELGLCALPWLYGSFSPATVARESGSPHGLVVILRQGWGQLEAEATPELTRLVRTLQADPRPLCAALEQYPWTLAHGDPNCKNFGLEMGAQPRLLLLDWQLVNRAPPAIDLVFFLSLFSDVLPVSYETVIERYRGLLAARLGDRFAEAWWQPQLDLAFLGHFLRFGALLLARMTSHSDAAVRAHYRMLLDWWTPRALAGASWL
ncbi:MAG: phosphotransferase [Chloroflexi bacterium]|nr:phosphotransferase [Chloroflexota bacterium]